MDRNKNHIRPFPPTINMSLPTNPSFRRMEPSDYDKGHLELLSQLSPFDATSVIRPVYEAFAESPTNNVWVLEESGKIIASGTLLLETKLIHALGIAGHIEDVVVHRDHRGKGLGKAMIDHLVAKAEHQGCYKVTLHCSDDNMGFYSRCGFSRKGNAMAVYF